MINFHKDICLFCKNKWTSKESIYNQNTKCSEIFILSCADCFICINFPFSDRQLLTITIPSINKFKLIIHNNEINFKEKKEIKNLVYFGKYKNQNLKELRECLVKATEFLPFI